MSKLKLVDYLFRWDCQAIYWNYDTRGFGLNWYPKAWWPMYNSMYYDGEHRTIYLGPLFFYWQPL